MEERVHEVMTQVASGERDVGIEERQVDMDEKTVVTTFMQSTCGCKKGPGSKPCSSLFSVDHLLSVRRVLLRTNPLGARYGCHGAADGRNERRNHH